MIPSDSSNNPLDIHTHTHRRAASTPWIHPALCASCRAHAPMHTLPRAPHAVHMHRCMPLIWRRVPRCVASTSTSVTATDHGSGVPSPRMLRAQRVSARSVTQLVTQSSDNIMTGPHRECMGPTSSLPLYSRPTSPSLFGQCHLPSYCWPMPALPLLLLAYHCCDTKSYCLNIVIAIQAK